MYEIAFGEFIENNETIEFLSIGNIKITDKGVEILSDYLIEMLQ